ncbi:GTP pyrophosphokinase family protein [Eubacterium limosum]|uniref:GTP pyrophosphokinase n=1 Tax=Eubacterium limosum TaxID=1736 RepID=UPI002FDABB9C
MIVLSTQYWQEFLIPYRQAVDELVLKFNSLKNQSMTLGENSPIESVRGRVKTVSSILEKINKYGFDVEDLETNIKDIAGIRIICQFVEDIYEVVDIIHERDGKDLRIVDVKNYMEGEDQSSLKSGCGIPKESGYQSYHLIIRYPVFCALGYREIYAEIQIRTLAMNFWSIIEHSLSYKYKEKLPEALKARLHNTADSVIGLDQEMSAIRDEIQQAQKLFKMKSSTVNSILDNIDNLYKLDQSDKAVAYERDFEDLSEQEDLIQLILLKKELESEISRIKEEN